MGSVQSGKTASMLAVIAKSLDRGADIVIVLAGTRTSLWKQTYSRLTAQLDASSDALLQRKRRILVPGPAGLSMEKGTISLSAAYRLNPAQVRRNIANRKPIIVVAMKQVDHLRALSKSLRESVFPALQDAGRSTHMLIFDDEADDGSVLDARIEASADPVYGAMKQIPRAIADLWSPRIVKSPQNLFASYVAYTATPQANFLQEDQNPLYPSDFVVSLRTPSDSGSVLDRSSSYMEPKGIASYYTGGSAFYERGLEAGLCVPTREDRHADLAEAVRAFLVAGAIRHIREGGGLGPTSAMNASFESLTEAKALSPSPHSMLVHPSAIISDHFSTAADILEWAGGGVGEESQPSADSGGTILPSALAGLVESEEEAWASWVDTYRRSSEAISKTYGNLVMALVPGWAEVKEALLNEIIPGTRVSIINSDPSSDNSPVFEPAESDGRWVSPRNLSTIFVAGNVMSRGITLEGLTTTLFLRESSSPLADSQAQMQRWFGYRGDYLDLCRVFAPANQLSLFNSYHNVDEALRLAILSRMQDGQPAPKPVVLQGASFLATGKIANLGNKPLCPGSQSLVRLVNPGTRPDPNVSLVADMFTGMESSDVHAGGVLRGRILNEPVSMTEAATLLDGLRYEKYNPGNETWQGQLWADVQARVEEQGPLEASGSLYRPPVPVPSKDFDSVRKDCPYSNGAYLRLWDACLTRRVKGLFPTESPSLPWSAVDLHARSRHKPRFWIAIRYGGEPAVEEGPLAKLPFKVGATSRSVEEGLLSGPWGSQMPSAGPHQYRGDQYLDYYHRNAPITLTTAGDRAWRPVGADGLILFYVNQPAGQIFPTIITGVCFPLGGPDQFAASLD